MIELCILGDNDVLEVFPLKAGLHVLGNTSQADVPLYFPTVSRLHAKLLVCEKTAEICDQGSRNGTTLDGNRLPANINVPWPENAIVKIGPFKLAWRHEKPRQISAQTPESSYLEKLADLYAGRLAESSAFLKSKSNANALVEECLKELDPQRTLSVETRTRLARRTWEEFHANGPLEKHFQDKNCREIIMNDYDEIFVDAGSGLQKIHQSFITPQSYAAWISRTAARCGRRIDLQHPICEATLENGARFHAVLPPVSFRAPSVSIRRFGSAPVDEQSAVLSGWLSPKALAILKEGVRQKKNIVISGGTSTGKTSLLNFLCQSLQANERVLTIEDTVELSIPVKDHVQLQARKANADGVGAISLRELVQSALRMRPDRIIVGECRGAEVLDMLQALNTGHPGSLTTIHANSPQEALQRLELLALLGAPNLTADILSKWIKQSVHWIVQVERSSEGMRYVDRILEISPEGTLPLYRRSKDIGQMELDPAG